MTSKERVYRTLRFEGPDRIPTDLWISPSAYMAHGQKLVDLSRRHPVDISPETKTRIPEISPRHRKGLFRDEWGSVWQNLQDGIVGEVVEPAIQSWSDLAAFRPPPADIDTMPKREDVKFREDTFHVAGGPNLFERMQWLRKPEQFYLDLAEQPRELFELRRILVDWGHQRIEHLLKQECDAVGFSDDWGSQRGLLIRPAQWREFFKPCYREWFDHARRAGRFVFFHSDGFITDIIEDLIALGVSALNSQVWCMGVEGLGRRFRGRITFWGEMNRQSTVPHGTPDQLRAAADQMKAHLADPRGGLIGQAEVDRLTPLENIEAILTAW